MQRTTVLVVPELVQSLSLLLNQIVGAGNLELLTKAPYLQWAHGLWISWR